MEKPIRSEQRKRETLKAADKSPFVEPVSMKCQQDGAMSFLIADRAVN